MKNSKSKLVTLDEFLRDAPKGAVYKHVDGPEHISFKNGRYVYQRNENALPEDLAGAWRMLTFDKAMYEKHKDVLDSYNFLADTDGYHSGVRLVCVTAFTNIRRP